MDIVKILTDLTNKYNDLATVLEVQGESDGEDVKLDALIKKCEERYNLFYTLHSLELSLKTYFEIEKKKQVKQKEANELDKLIEDPLTLQERMVNMITHYKNNPEFFENMENVEKSIEGKDVSLYILKKEGNNLILYNKETAEFYYGYITLSQGKDAYTFYNILGKVELPFDTEPYLTLLNKLYLEILNLKKNTTSGSSSSQSPPQAPIEPPRVSQEVETKLSFVEKARNAAASGLRKIAASLTQATQPQPSPTGGKKTTYRLNGEKVLLLHKNKKVQRSIYVKDKGKTKYCKIDKEYVLLSKVKNKIQ